MNENILLEIWIRLAVLFHGFTADLFLSYIRVRGVGGGGGVRAVEVKNVEVNNRLI